MPLPPYAPPNAAEAAKAVDDVRLQLAPVAGSLERTLGPARWAVFQAMLESAKDPRSNNVFSLPMTNWDTGLEESITPPEDNATYLFELAIMETLGGNFQATLNLVPDVDSSNPAAEDLPQIGFGFEVNRGLPVAMVYEDPIGGDVSLMLHGLPAEQAGQGSRLLVNVTDDDMKVHRDPELLPSLTEPDGRATRPHLRPFSSA